VYSIAWSPDGDFLATGSSDGYIRLWDVEAGEKYADMKGHDNFVSYLSWSPADPYLLSTGADGTVRIWNTAPSNMVLRLPNYGYVNMGDWSPDGRHFMVGTNVAGIAVWDMQTGRPSLETVVDKDTSWWWYPYYSPDGRFILARTHADFDNYTEDPNKWYLLDNQTGEIIRMLETGKDTFLVEPGWSPDMQLIASGDMDGTFYFWNANTGELVKMMQCLIWANR
jgi:WD40 repeat protein